MKASDAFAALLADAGCQRAYGLQGGAVVHLFDSLERGGRIACHYLHHEQSAAFAAVADAKASHHPGLVIVTTGPGGTNALTGLLAAWQDSVPVLFVSGQTRLAATSYGRPLRQLGSQEFAILDAVRSFTKYAALVRDAASLPRLLHEALAAATTGRPGPVWLDFPLDVQWQQCPPPDSTPRVPPPPPPLSPAQSGQLAALATALATARRPLLLAGHGVHLADAAALLRSCCAAHGLPLVATWGGSDLLPTDHPLNGGVIGVNGQRGANQLVHHCDLLLVLGANLTPPQIGGAPLRFAPEAAKWVLSFDAAQLAASGVDLTTHLEVDLHVALSALSARLNAAPPLPRPAWLAQVQLARQRNRRGSVDLDSRALTPAGGLSSNIAVALLSRALQHTHHLVVDGGGTALYAGFQSAVRGPDRRLVCSTGISSMGTGLAESVGVSLATARSPVLTIIGDGSFLMNVRDLASLTHPPLPVAVLILNNRGYLAIRHTQRDYLGARYAGTDEAGGLYLPPFGKIVEGFGLPYRKITSYDELASAAADLARQPAGLVLDVQVDPAQDTLFRPGLTVLPDGTTAPADLSEMWPFTAS